MSVPCARSTKSERGVALELRGVHKTFRSESGEEVKALEDLNLRVEDGEFVTLIGATGCGKSTTLNVIANLVSVGAGEVHLADGLCPGENIACVFQHYTLFPWRSVLRNVAFGLEMRGFSRREWRQRARSLLEQVGLSRFENAYPHELSGGMRQRAAIAQALAIEPNLLLMDEPFGALDDSTRKDLQQMLTDLWQRSNITVLFVTHNIDEAVVMGNRVLVFSERPGRIVREYKVDLPRPRDRMTKEFTDLFIEVRHSLATSLD